jgi:hypothetical protein
MVHDLPFGEGAGAPNPSITHVQPAPAQAQGDPNVITPAIVPPHAENPHLDARFPDETGGPGYST